MQRITRLSLSLTRTLTLRLITSQPHRHITTVKHHSSKRLSQSSLSHLRTNHLPFSSFHHALPRASGSTLLSTALLASTQQAQFSQSTPQDTQALKNGLELTLSADPKIFPPDIDIDTFMVQQTNNNCVAEFPHQVSNNQNESSQINTTIPELTINNSDILSETSELSQSSPHSSISEIALSDESSPQTILEVVETTESPPIDLTTTNPETILDYYHSILIPSILSKISSIYHHFLPYSIWSLTKRTALRTTRLSLLTLAYITLYIIFPDPRHSSPGSLISWVHRNVIQHAIDHWVLFAIVHLVNVYYTTITFSLYFHEFLYRNDPTGIITKSYDALMGFFAQHFITDSDLTTEIANENPHNITLNEFITAQNNTNWVKYIDSWVIQVNEVNENFLKEREKSNLVVLNDALEKAV